MTELRIRVKDLIKTRLEELKKKTGLSINYYVNYAIVKQLLLDEIIIYWEYDNITKKDPHYEYINKLPEDLKFCDGDSCELPFGEKLEGRIEEMKPDCSEYDDPITNSKPRGDKC